MEGHLFNETPPPHVAVRCSVVDHRWHKNIIRTKHCYSKDSQVCHWCSSHILTASEIFSWTDVQQHGFFLFYKKEGSKILLIVMSSISLSSNRSYVRANQNECIIQLLYYLAWHNQASVFFFFVPAVQQNQAVNHRNAT